MKTKRIFAVLIMLLVALMTFAQHYKKDGTPDMRYKENKTPTSTTFSIPSTTTNNNFSTPSATTNSSVRYQNTYQKSDGTQVQSHYKTNSNETNTDNFSTKGNTNTFTGKEGTKAKDYSNDAKNYGSGKTIQEGPKGGQYYINSKGNKVYVPKR